LQRHGIWEMLTNAKLLPDVSIWNESICDTLST